METVNAVPVFLIFGCVAGLAVALFAIAALLNPRQYVGPVQKMPYESGMDPIHDTRRRFDVRFHLIAIAFLVFDVEVLFLYPWAVAAKRPDATETANGMATVGGSPSPRLARARCLRTAGNAHRYPPSLTTFPPQSRRAWPAIVISSLPARWCLSCSWA